MPRKKSNKAKSRVSVNQKQGVNIKIDLSKRTNSRKTPKEVVIQRPSFQMPQQTVHQPDQGILYNILQKVSTPQSNLQTLTEPTRRLYETNSVDNAILNGTTHAQDADTDTIQNELEASVYNSTQEPVLVHVEREPLLSGASVGGVASLASSIVEPRKLKGHGGKPKYIEEAEIVKEYMKSRNPETYKSMGFYKKLKNYVGRAEGAKLSQSDVRQLIERFDAIKHQAFFDPQ